MLFFLFLPSRVAFLFHRNIYTTPLQICFHRCAFDRHHQGCVFSSHIFPPIVMTGRQEMVMENPPIVIRNKSVYLLNITQHKLNYVLF